MNSGILRLRLSRSLPFFLAAALVLIIILTSHTRIGGSHDGSRMAMIENILTKNVIWTETSAFFNTVDMVYDHGHFYSDKPPVFTLYTAGLLYPFRHWVHITPNDSLIYYLIVLSSAGISALGLIFLMAYVLELMGAEKRLTFHILSGSVLGTATLPFMLTYASHLTEALLCFVSFAGLIYCRTKKGTMKIALLMGAALGLSTVIHPFMGCVFLATGGLYFLIRKNLTLAVALGLSFVFVVFLGFGLNRILFQSWRPYYFDPVKYLYAIKTDKKIMLSGFFMDPKLRGLTREILIQRSEELGLPKNLERYILGRFEIESGQKHDHAGFVVHKWTEWDFATFSPLILFCCISILLSCLSRSFRYRLEYAWIFASMLMAYLMTIYFGSLPGSSYGNRYLIPLLPVIVTAGGFCQTSEKRKKVMIILYLILFASIIPAASRPWNTPNPAYRIFNIYFTAGLDLLIVVAWALKSKFQHYYEIILDSIRPNLLFNLLWVLWAVFQCCLYFKNLPEVFIPRMIPRSLILMLVVPAVLMMMDRLLRKSDA